MSIRFYGPTSDAGFLDIVDELGRRGLSCVTAATGNTVRCTWHGARFTIVRDDDGIRAQVLDDGGMGSRAWDAVDPVLSRSSIRTGSAIADAGSHYVGAFFYDADLAKFGNAFSPFVQTDSFARANLALQRSFEDRYNPRYDAQPTWSEWQDLFGDGEAFATRGVFDDLEERVGIDRKTALASVAIAAATGLFIARNTRYALEIATAGVAGITVTMAVGMARALR